MTALLFDTHAAIKDLIGAGLAEKEAEAIVKVMKSSQGELATKTDIELIRRDMLILKRDMIIWLGGIVIATGVVVSGVMFALLKMFIPGS